MQHSFDVILDLLCALQRDARCSCLIQETPAVAGAAAAKMKRLR